MVFIPAGVFGMGDYIGDTVFPSDELPPGTVFISDFFIDRFEVTNEDMRSVMQWAFDNLKISASSTGVTNAEGNPQQLLNLAANPNTPNAITFDGSTFSVSAGRDDHPCVWVSWYGAVAYCNYLSQREGRTPCYNLSDWSCNFAANGYRLPTEAEWEKAARGGLEGARFPWGDLLSPALANYNVGGSSGNSTPVGSYPANGYGLHDAAGNAFEWCWDWYSGTYYTVQPGSDPTGPLTGTDKCSRGGSFGQDWERIRVSRRERIGPGFSFYDAGFRVVLPSE
jgi:formylglycine-generating enzyme required for sulfatase activity